MSYLPRRLRVKGRLDPIHSQMQVCVHIHYRGYRRAYKKAFPHEDIDRKVISHAKNRRIADLQGFQYVRITPISRGSNSSSAFSEQWGVDIHSTPTQMAANRSRGAFIHYGALAAIMLMMGIKLGGGVMDVVNEGQKLVREPEIAKIPNKKRTDWRFLYLISSSKRYINNFRFPKSV